MRIWTGSPPRPAQHMYIRPFIFGDEVSFSVLPAKHYKFMIILSPVGSYYAANDGGLTTTRDLRAGRVHPRSPRRHRLCQGAAATTAARCARPWML